MVTMFDSRINCDKTNLMAVQIPFQKNLEFAYGVADQLSPLVRRVIADNPSAFTLFGTGTYIVGRGNVAIIDPGPADQTHIDAILSATQGERITHIFVTHTHVDHSPGCELLQQSTTAKTYALGRHGMGRERDESEFGADWNFNPDVLLTDGETVAGDQWSLSCVFSPGHAANHLSFYLEQEGALFCGDAVMGWSTTIVSPPDGNMHDYMNTLKKLRARQDNIYYPTHGAPIERPGAYIQALYDHRLEREQQVIDCVRGELHSVNDMLAVVYSELDPAMYPAASRSLLATIERLLAQNRLKTGDHNGEETINEATRLYLSTSE